MGGVKGGMPQKFMFYVNSGVFNSGKSKNDVHFHFRVPPTPQRASLGGGGLGAIGGIPSKIMCYVNSGVFNSGKSKSDHKMWGLGLP